MQLGGIGYDEFIIRLIQTVLEYELAI